MIGGVLTDACVESSARQAAERGLQVFVAEDAFHATSLANLSSYFARVVSTSQIIWKLESGRPLSSVEGLNHETSIHTFIQITTTPTGRLLLPYAGGHREFERDLVRDKVLAGLRRARVQGTKSGKRIGQPRAPVDVGRPV